MSSVGVSGTAIGLLETKGLTALVEATDAMVKTAHVQIARRISIGGGLVTTIVVGELASVRVAIEVGAATASKTGQLLASHVIARPSEALLAAFL